MKRSYNKDENKYFFELKGDELALALKDKIEEYQEYCVTEGHYNQWRKNERFYHNNFFSDYKTVDILDTGAEGEIQAASLTPISKAGGSKA